MSDAPAGTAMEIAAAAEPAEWLQRLQRRRTEPMGVIDVRWPQMHYARTAGWTAQRFPLLQQLAARYGGDEGQPDSGLVYRTAAAFPSEPVSAFMLEKAFPPAAGVSSAVSTVPPVTLRVSRRPPSMATKAAPAAVPVLPSTPEESPSSSHQAVLAPAGAGNTTSGGDSPTVPADWQHSPGEPSTETTARPELRRVKPAPLAASQPTTQLLSPTLTLPPQGGWNEAAVQLQRQPDQPRITPTLTLPPQGGGNEPAVQLQRQPDDTQASAVPASTATTVDSLSPPVAMEIHHNTTLAQESGMVWRKSTDTLVAPESVTGAGGDTGETLPVTLPLAASQPTTQLLLRAFSAVPAAVAPASPSRAAPPPQPAAALQPRITPTLTLPPQGGGNEPAAQLQRQGRNEPVAQLQRQGGNEPVAQLQRQPDDIQASAVPASAVVAGAVDSRSPPVAMEIRHNTTFAQESGMVWRKSTNALMAPESGIGIGRSARAMLPLTLNTAGNSPPPVARQAMTTETATVPASLPTHTQSLPSLPSVGTPSPVGIAWEQLIERVSRHILRQLTIARERRGLKGWN